MCEIRGGKVLFVTDWGKMVELEADPFIGTIGVSPEFESITTLSWSSWG